MNLFKINNNTLFFCIEPTKEIKVSELTTQDLVNLLDNSYKDPNYYTINWEDMAEKVHNQIDKEIASQISRKLQDFIKNVETIKSEIENQFPLIH